MCGGESKEYTLISIPIVKFNMFIWAELPKFVALLDQEISTDLWVPFYAGTQCAALGWIHFFHVLSATNITKILKATPEILANYSTFRFLLFFFWSIILLFAKYYRDVATQKTQTDTVLDSWFVGLLLVHLFLLISFNLPMILHKWGSQDSRSFRIYWLVYK